MTALQQLDEYVRKLETRLRFFAASRGAAAAVACALALTVILVWISNQYRFADGILLPMRILLFAGIAAVVAWGLALPLSRLNRARVTRLAESRIPELKERLLTATERRDPNNPFTEIVAEDALRIAHTHPNDEFVPATWLWSSVAALALLGFALIWMITSAPGYWGYGASLLWTGTASAATRPLYDIAVQPGSKTIRRKSDQVITAQLLGFSHRNVTLHAKYRGGLKWDEIPMQTEANGSGYQFLFAGLSDALDYYIQAGDTRSKQFTLSVKDLPAVKRVRVGLHYPSGIGLKDVVEEGSGDIRAVEGSKADVSVLTDRTLEHGVLVLDSGTKIDLTRGENNWSTARLSVTKDGSYHVAAIEDGETIRISDDYFIESKKDEPPTVKILRPGRDPRVSPIEELPVTVDAADDFGIEGLELHYSVNGGPEQTSGLLKSKGTKEAQGKTTLYLENLKLVPGDVVSMYATARDANKTTRSDILFAQAEPFDFKFRQSQQSGGGGGGGAEEGAKISERQKEIIAATWNELKDPKKERAALAENARFLADLEGKLGEQSKTLANRMGSRELSGSSPQFEQFSKAMNEAAGSMSQAVDRLKPGKWQDALSPEQKALQSLLHAESIFRDIQVSFGQSASGGMGSGGANRDLARMFDLELDSSKNQYESNQKAAPSQGGDQQKQLDDALQRLKDLARRQQELAEQHQQAKSFQQRWEEEQLRRETEELRQQMQQMAKNQQGQAGQSGQQSRQQQSGQQSGQSSGQSGQQSSQQAGQQSGQQASGQGQSAMRQATDSIQRAEDEMRRAVTDHDGTAQQRAAQQLAQAQKALSDKSQQQAGNSVSDLAQKAQQLAENQKNLANRIKQQYGAEGINTARRPGEDGQNGNGLAMPEMSGPGFAGGWRRRFMREDVARPPTIQEKALASENEKLAGQVEQLQQKMQEQAHSLAGQQPETTSKLRKALSDAEQEELALRMQKNSEWLRKGFGSQTWQMEDSITAGMDQLSQQLRDAQQALRSGDSKDEKGTGSTMAEALSRVRSLRQELENSATGADSRGKTSAKSGSQRNSQRGSQPGSQSGSQTSGQEDGGQQANAQPGKQGGSQQGNQPGEGQGAQSGERASGSPSGGGRPSVGGRGSDVEGTIEQLSTLRGQLGRGDRRLNGDVNDAIGWLRHMKGQDGLLDARVNQDAVTSLERLEVELGHRVGLQQADGARTTNAEVAPEKYRDEVAEYFRRLSK